MKHSPIFIMSFDRSEYLIKVLESLRRQIDCKIDERAIVLFQDGAVNSFSGKRYATDDAIRNCVDTFRQIFPHGKVMESPSNLGVALNFDRAERYGFEELGAESVIFLEDDLVLGEAYISTIDHLLAQFLDDDRVGYLAAYGDHTKSLEQQQANRTKLIPLGHNWGFALIRRQWLRIQPRVNQYLELIKDVDYRDRDSDKICSLFMSWGYGDPAVSQDAAKTIACCAEGIVKLNTYICNATYIGARGLHMNDRLFADRGYAKTALFPERVTSFEKLDHESYSRLLGEMMQWAKSSRKNSVDEKAAAQFAELRSRGEEIVVAAYRALLQRDPDDSGLENYRSLFGGLPLGESVYRTIRGLLGSAEFARRWESAEPLWTSGILVNLQKALLNRITANVRGVACETKPDQVLLRFVVDGPVLEGERANAECVRESLVATYASVKVTYELIRLDYPADRESFALKYWAYLRQEHR